MVSVVTGDRLLRVKDVLLKTSFSRTKLYGMLAEGRFPQPVKIDKATCWRESTVDLWIAEVMEESGP